MVSKMTSTQVSLAMTTTLVMFSVIFPAMMSQKMTSGTYDVKSTSNMTSGKRLETVCNIWSSMLWTRFPKEVFPLFLSEYIERGDIEEGQRRSRVSGWEKGVDVESYSGYLTVDKRYDSNLFFWFFPAEKDQDSAPVLLWLNGGPGRSSLVGALLENGPLTITVNGTVERRNVSWTESFSMLYIDNPVGVGYSFTLHDEGYSKSLDDMSRNLYSALIQFFQLFPKYANNDFYAGGQSYAGKYIPALGWYIHQRNVDTRSPPKLQLNFKGIYLGAGFCDPEHMMPEFYDYMYKNGFISDRRRREMQRDISALIRDGLSGKDVKTVWEYLALLFNVIREVSLDSSDNLLGAEATNHHLLDACDDFPLTAVNRMILHTGNMSSKFSSTDKRHPSYKLVQAMQETFLQSTSRENGFLMDNYKVLHYSGNLDVIVNVAMTEAFLNHVQWAGRGEYMDSDRHVWKEDGELAGWYITVRNFTRVVVRNAGHMVPYDTPERALAMMQRFVFGNFNNEDS